MVQAGFRHRSPPYYPAFLDVYKHQFEIYDLFGGTEQIHQLVISRAISGLHIR
jgi:hypothetical protein